MITCNYCGYQVPEGAYNCPKCGAPLPARGESGPGSRVGGQEQQAIPAWLETLRVGERPVAPASNSSNFSAADLIEEGALPSWMRPERAEPTRESGPFNPVRPGAEPGPAMKQGMMPQRGLEAQSLIDEQSLPSWMREGQASGSGVPSSNFEAKSLIDAEALPDWMSSLQPQQPERPEQRAKQSAPGAAPDWMRSLQPQQERETSPAPMQSAPDWMKSAQAPLPATPQSEPLVSPVSTGFSARELLDEQSLPSWMTQQGGQAAIPGSNQPVQPGTLSPSSLIDKSVLPDWMHDNKQVTPGRSIPSAHPALPRQAPVQPPTQAPFGQNTTGQNGNVAASSFIDTNALPDWLRAGGPQQGQGMPAQPEASRPGAYNGPAHIENVRVPSRPRGEVNANEGNEVAANVFASMLGVASPAPQFPGPPAAQASYGQQQANQLPQGQQSMNAASLPGQAPAYNPPIMPQQIPASANPPVGPISQGYVQGGYGSGYMSNPAGKSSLGVPVSGAAPSQPSYNVYSTATGAAGQAEEQKASKKRGLVDTLLGWLLH